MVVVPRTAAAVVAFQKVTGLPGTGQANAGTMARLFPKPELLEAALSDDEDDDNHQRALTRSSFFLSAMDVNRLTD